jgi:hypothetical protein
VKSILHPLLRKSSPVTLEDSSWAASAPLFAGVQSLRLQQAQGDPLGREPVSVFLRTWKVSPSGHMQMCGLLPA